MTAKVEMCNMALSKVGENFIRDIGENTKPAKLCALMFDPVRDAVLRAYPWRFAMKRWELSPVARKPLFGFENAFKIPSDCLRVVSVDGCVPYAREGDCFLSDVKAFRFAGVSRVAEESKFDAVFTEAFTTKLAAEMVMSLTSLPALKEQLNREYEALIAEARRTSAKEASQDVFGVHGWLEARL